MKIFEGTASRFPVPHYLDSHISAQRSSKTKVGGYR